MRHEGDGLSGYYQRLMRHDRPHPSVTTDGKNTIELIQLGEAI